jgi:hypothetical protein
MVFTCKDCGQEFLSSSEYKRHQQTHLQTHLDKWSTNTKPDKVSWKPPEGMNQDLFKIFEKYRLGERAMLCLWYNGQLNTAIREPSRILESQDRLKEWLQELR